MQTSSLKICVGILTIGSGVAGFICNSPVTSYNNNNNQSVYRNIYQPPLCDFQISGLKDSTYSNPGILDYSVSYIEKGENMDLKLTRNLNKLTYISSLALGEDESITFSDDFIKKIGNILNSISNQPEIFPNFRGNIQLEYEEENGKYLEIEITPNMKMNIFKIDEDGTEHENEDFFDISIDEINKEVNAFYEYI